MKDSLTRAVDDIIARGLYEKVELSPETHQFAQAVDVSCFELQT